MNLPVGPQRDACHVLEICFDPEGPMHSSCDTGDCYGALLQGLTSFEAKQELRCKGCSYNTHKAQKQCVLRVEPHGDAEKSIRASLQASDVEFKCAACDAKQTTHLTSLHALPQFLIVHINKYADGFGVATPRCVKVAGRDMERIAVMHHLGHTPDSGHYTATVTTTEGLAYVCDDETVTPWSQQSWQNGYLLFLHRASSSDTHPTAEESSCGDAHPAAYESSEASGEEVVIDEAECCSTDPEGHYESEDNQGTDANDPEGHDESEDNQDSDANSRDDAHLAAVEYEVQAMECRATSSRHDDWLHRGPFLADLPWHAYMMGVQRACLLYTSPSPRD